MRSLILVAAAALAVAASPAAAQTITAPTSQQLELIASQVETTQGDWAGMEKTVLAYLREPAKTVSGVTLPTTAAQYLRNFETALKLQPKGWTIHLHQAGPAGSPYYAGLSKWVAGAPPEGGLKMEVFGTSPYQRGAAMTAAVLKAYAFELKQRGR